VESQLASAHVLCMAKAIIVRQRRLSPILVCKKCLRRSDEGKDIKRGLKAALKQRADADVKPARLVSTSCFGLCPKRSVVVASGASLRNSEYALVSSDEDVNGALDLL
jgi:predicted metal-binding protein